MENITAGSRNRKATEEANARQAQEQLLTEAQEQSRQKYLESKYDEYMLPENGSVVMFEAQRNACKATLDQLEQKLTEPGASPEDWTNRDFFREKLAQLNNEWANMGGNLIDEVHKEFRNLKVILPGPTGSELRSAAMNGRMERLREKKNVAEEAMAKRLPDSLAQAYGNVPNPANPNPDQLPRFSAGSGANPNLAAEGVRDIVNGIGAGPNPNTNPNLAAEGARAAAEQVQRIEEFINKNPRLGMLQIRARELAAVRNEIASAADGGDSLKEKLKKAEDNFLSEKTKHDMERVAGGNEAYDFIISEAYRVNNENGLLPAEKAEVDTLNQYYADLVGSSYVALNIKAGETPKQLINRIKWTGRRRRLGAWLLGI